MPISRTRCLLPALSLLLAAPLAPAAELRHGPSLSGGTDGFGVGYDARLTPHFGLRAAYQTGSYAYEKGGDSAYDIDFKLSTVTAMADYRPFGGGFRLSAGTYIGTPKATLTQAKVDTYQVDGQTLRADLQLSGKTDLGSVAPYLGLGWSVAGRTGFGVAFDAGFIFGQSPKVDLTATGRACNATLLSNCNPNGLGGYDINDPALAAYRPAAEAVLEQERSEMEDEARAYRHWPVLRLSVQYLF